VGLANTLYDLRDLAGSEALLRDALAQRPDSVPVLNDLAMVVGEQGRIDEALALVAAAERAPGPYRDAVADTRRAIESRRSVASPAR
jgi:Flp pilus assembly protein TadD